MRSWKQMIDLAGKKKKKKKRSCQTKLILFSRVHTAYFGKSGTAYQEMGPMRFPIEFDYKGKTLPITDHHIVFQLVEELNSINKKSLHVEFIKWYQSGDK